MNFIKVTKPVAVAVYTVILFMLLASLGSVRAAEDTASTLINRVQKAADNAGLHRELFEEAGDGSLAMDGVLLDQLQEPVTIAGLYDTSNYGWGEELIDFTVRLLNNHSNGWFDDILRDTPLRYTISNAACDENTAVRAFVDITRDAEDMPNVVMGCRCSGPTIAVASIAAALNIAMLSMAASAARLSDVQKYPTFSRLVAPDNADGQVGALIQFLRAFDWNQINIVSTQLVYATDFKVELEKVWKADQGVISYSDTVQFYPNTQIVNPASVEQTLKSIEKTKASRKSKVVVLLAHHQNAFEILKIAHEMKFQPDTIWVGVDAWTGAEPGNLSTSWMPDIPGYIGIFPHINQTLPAYTDFMSRLQKDQLANNRSVTTQLPTSTAHRMVDSVVALAMALSKLPPAERRNGTAITHALTKVRFKGVAGDVAFNEIGDWAHHPKYSVMTLPARGKEWISIGHVTPNTSSIDFSRICYAELGCNQPIPDERFPVPREPWEIMVIVLSTVIGVLLLVGFAFYMLYPKSMRRKIKELEAEIEGVNSNQDSDLARKGRLYREIATLLGQPPPAEWAGGNGLIDIPPTDHEYWEVLQKMRATIDSDETCHITSLSRVKNEGIWSHYVFRKNQLGNKHGVDMDTLCEEEVWHGTSGLNPDIIYNDQQDGFMTNYSRQGLYGRGIYFADRFSYSDCYSYRVQTGLQPPDPDQQYQENREIFLVKLLVGKAVKMDHKKNEIACRELVAPPEITEGGGIKYDTVTGEVGDGEYKTKIHVAYENGRAFPKYLIRYYKVSSVFCVLRG